MFGDSKFNQFAVRNQKNTQLQIIPNIMSDTRKEVSIVIPAYNEEKRIKNTLMDLTSILKEQDQIIVVFDGTDGTPDVVRSFGDKVELLISTKRLGKGGAILSGFEKCRNEVIGFIDADNAVPVSDVLRLASQVSEDSPCVIGSRWVRSSKVIKNEPFFNIFAGRVFHYIVYLILGIKAKDTQCGAKFFSRELLREILPRITVRSRMIDVALLYHVKLLGKKITELGVTWFHNEDTNMPILKAIPFMFATLLGLKISHDKRFKKRAEFLRKFGESLEHN